MAEGQEYAVVLPRSNAARIFAQSYLRSRENAEQKTVRRQQGEEREAQLQAKEQAESNANFLRLMQGYGNGISSADPDVMQAINTELHRGLSAGSESNLKKENTLQSWQAMQPHTDKAKQLVTWGQQLVANTKDLFDSYKNINGVNPAQVALIINDYKTKNGVGNFIPSVENLAQIVESKADDLIQSPKAFDDFVSKIPSQTISIRTGANGLQTAGGESWDIPNDAEISGNGLKAKAVPKSELFKSPKGSLMQPGTTGQAQKQIIDAQNFISEATDNTDGSIRLYDKAFYQAMMQDEGSKRVINKEFNTLIKDFEAKGQSFPRGGQVEEMAKRAIAYKMRVPRIDAKYNQAISAPVYHNTKVVHNSTSSATVPVNNVYDRIAQKLDNAKVQGSVDSVVPAAELEGDELSQVLKQARDAANDEDRKKMGADNLMVVNENGKLWIAKKKDAPKEQTAAERAGSVFSPSYAKIRPLERLKTDIPSQANTKAKAAVVARGNAPVKQPSKKIILKGTVR